jgi:CheY-like chemotaxis protein
VLLNVCAAVILVVDDDQSVRKSLYRLLSAHGYEVYEASDHTGALEHARQRRPNVLILDLHMSRLSGLDIARAVKADAALSSIHLIAFSASIPDWDEDMKLFTRVVEKPAPVQILLDAIAGSMPVCASIAACEQ